MLRELVRSGKSFSGHERHCCYLNTGQTRWGNISSVSGLDVPDDGRGVAITDWDHDGDLDMWIVNRSGPQIRFFENNLEKRPRNSFITFRLQAGNGNRDAIGARVEVALSHPKAKLLKTLRAGDGYLSQSSKTVHFGIPANSKIEQVTIRWPDQQLQSIGSLAIGEHYAVTQRNAPREWSPADRSAQGADGTAKSLPNIESERPSRQDSTGSRVFLTTPIPIPKLHYRSMSGGTTAVEDSGQHHLLNLWSTTCQPCLVELAHFTQQEQRLRASQVDVVSICVDPLMAETGAIANMPTSTETLSRLNYPFRNGLADDRLVDLLQVINNQLLDLYQPLPVPCSFLIDTRGRLVAIYRGSVEVEQILEDVARSSSTAVARRESAMIFPGKWSGDPRSSRLLTLALSMLEAGFVEETMGYLEAHRDRFELDRDLPILLFNIAQQLTIRKDHTQAIRFYRQAIERNPRLSSAHYNLAITLLQSGEEEQAKRHLEQTIEIEPDSPDALLYLGQLAARQGELTRSRELLARAGQIRPGHAETQFQLALVSVLDGGLESGLEHYRTAVRLDPTHYGHSSRKSQFLAGLEVALKSLTRSPGTAPHELSRWREAIEDVRRHEPSQEASPEAAKAN